MLKSIDLKSLLVAGAIGAVLLYLIDYSQSLGSESPSSTVLVKGFVVGAVVQIGLRTSGVS